MDLDRFKRVVDEHGHLNGSRVIQEVATTIRGALPEGAFAVAYAGDEFVVVLPGFGKDAAVATAETIRTRVAHTIYLAAAGQTISLTMSLGVATFPDDADRRPAPARLRRPGALRRQGHRPQRRGPSRGRVAPPGRGPASDVWHNRAGRLQSLAVPLLAPLNPDQRATFLVVAMAPKALRKLVGRLGTAPTGTRLETMSVWDLAWSLVDYYDDDVEVARTVDKTLLKDLGEPPLLAARPGRGGRRRRERAGACLARSAARSRLGASGRGHAGERAARRRRVQAIVTEFDDADARAKAEEDAACDPESADDPRGGRGRARDEDDAAEASRARGRASGRSSAWTP